MQELIDVIRAAIATDATKDQKAAGVQACRTIAVALDTEPGRPLAILGAPSVPATSRVSIDQMLDLMIARLGVIAKDREEREERPALAAPPATASTATPPVASRGLRVPMATGSALKAAPRRANTARPVPPRKP
jgi:hypothetical protein